MYIQARQYAILNKILAVCIVGLGLYIAVAPLAPEGVFWLRQQHVLSYWDNLFARDEELVLGPITPRRHMPAAAVTVEPVIPAQNMLSIPQIGVYAPIVEGVDARAMEHGAWHRPGTGNPLSGGNMVLVGHRFLYTSGPKTFYHLDKVRVGETLTVYWSGQAYRYVVESVLVTLPNAVEIEQHTDAALLTIYTCTPLFTVDKRLVVRARPIEL